MNRYLFYRFYRLDLSLIFELQFILYFINVISYLILYLGLKQ